MAHAMVKGQKYLVRVTQDLAENWSVEAYPQPAPQAIKRSEPFKVWPVPLCMKVKADTREDALVCALEHMKKLKKIDDYLIDPSEMPKPPEPAAKKAEADEADDA